MPITKGFTLPKSKEELQISSSKAFFIAFLASKDPATNKPWCPDVIATLPTLEATFQGEKRPTAAFVEVGQRPEWKDAKNVFRTKWNVQNVPTLVRYDNIEGDVKEVGRLTEGEILDETRLQGLLYGAAKKQ